MVTPPMWDFQITPEQGRKIALVSTNWAMVDNELGSLLEKLAGIQDSATGAELVHAIDLRKKIEILDRRRKGGRVPVGCAPLIQELVWCGSNFYADRNMLAHGIIGGGSPEHQVAWSQSKLKALNLTHLDAIVGEAQYTAHVAHHLFMAAHGAGPESLDPLPPRPPLRPPQP
jgi:hypothetical protein